MWWTAFSINRLTPFSIASISISRTFKSFLGNSNNEKTSCKLFYNLHCSSNFSVGYQETFNVLDYGAVGDGQNDDSEAFLKAWNALCVAKGTPTLVVPKEKTFLLQPTKFSGPCKSNDSIHVEILGKIVAPNTPQEWKECEKESWLLFSEVNNLNFNGNETGVINGNGSPWWRKVKQSKCYRPKALRFFKCNDLQLSGLTHVDSPKGHVSIVNCTNVIVSNLHIIAPDDSKNTDGTDIIMSRHVNIQDCIIGTGDDCIAINNGSVDVNVTNIVCGPGHGISVGSIGEEGAYETVAEVHVRNCTFNGTMNGARIKTWPGGSGYARNISFEQITLIGAKNPIIIDQNYCNGKRHCGDSTSSSSAVEVSNVTYYNIQGTMADDQAITFDCSKNADDTLACLNIDMKQINITSIDPETEISVRCKNVNGTIDATSPDVHCLQARTSTIVADNPDAYSPDTYAFSF